jgi:stearoyl-CoA desaturase (delta-9 desaturase)
MANAEVLSPACTTAGANLSPSSSHGSLPSETQNMDSLLSLDEILKSLPSEVFQKSTLKACRTLFVSISMFGVGLYLLSVMPWFFLPLGWLFVGTVYAGFSTVGIDCSTGSFSKYKVLNNIVGNIVCLPLIFPFETWRLQITEFAAQGLPALPTIRGPLWWLSSVYQWVRSNFLIYSVYIPGNRTRIVLSLVCLYVFISVFFPLMLYNVGIWGLVKYWFIPWLVYHFWMSTFVSTCSMKIPFLQDTSVRFSISKYPQWVEFLTHDMNYVVASLQQVREAIPSYNIKKSLVSIKQQCGKQCYEYVVGRDTISQLLSLREIQEVANKINWPTTLFLLISPLIALYGISTTSLNFNTALWFLVSYQMAGLGITVGYHRMWSHRAFEAHKLFKYFMLYCGTSAFEGSVLWWCRDHRAHHRYTDTDKDPYSIKKGFWWAHMGWLLVQQDQEKVGKTDISDLESDKALQFQDKYYTWLALLSGWGIPTVVAGLVWGDWRGGFFYASVLRSVLVLQATFCINSLAHFIGEYTFTDERTARDSWWVSLVTFGEGYHNFHHEFPYDYRNGVWWLSYDPSKWLVYLLSFVGLTYNLKRFPDNEIAKGILQMQERRIQAQKGKLDWGRTVESLPEYTADQVANRAKEGASLIVIDGLVYDVAHFIDSHPGGAGFIRHRLGRDASAAFNGGVYSHGNAARNLLSTMRVGKLKVKSQ